MKVVLKHVDTKKTVGIALASQGAEVIKFKVFNFLECSLFWYFGAMLVKLTLAYSFESDDAKNTLKTVLACSGAYINEF